ncbi:alpha/beta fold hydrolase [Haladaptatus sp. DYSN1]|nr:alpha/beta hydrolase [Haladaptatus sp. DYSN1]
MVSRPVGFGQQSTAAMADGYAGVLEETGPAAIMGLSMGGFIVQHLAAERPDLVTGAILGLSAAAFSHDGHETISRWHEWGGRRQWRRIYREAADTVSSGLVQRGFSLVAQAYSVITRGPKTPADFLGTAQSSLDHDARATLGDIEVPTLTIGGTNDPFFDEADFRETANLLGGDLHLLPGLGHEAVIHHSRDFDDPINRFLADGAQF